MSMFAGKASRHHKTTSKERQRDAQRKRAQRAGDREVAIPPCDDRKRRERLEADDFAWLRWYCPDLFWYDFTIQQREMIEAIRNAIRFGGDQSLAASRGEGKTKIFERMLLKYTLSGVVSFSVLFAATGATAQDSLESIKTDIETNPLLLADYPEVCVPVRALENTPNRAHYQLVSGRRHDNGEPYLRAQSRFKWCGQEIVLPNVPGSPSAAAIIATRGLDAAVRGLNKRNRRPDVAGIDDPDTEETASSEEQAAKLEKRIDRAIAGLGGQQRGIARVMLTTLQNRTCVSYKYTDRKQKPSWKGRRFRFLISPPAHPDLWDEYVMLRRADMEAGDEFARRAHRFYLEHRAEMDAGAEVANPHRYDGRTLDDGTQLEVSALQRYYNEIARIGPEAVACEYDNDPPPDTEIQESGITASRIQRQVSGYPRKCVPPGCTHLTQGIDVRKVHLHFVVRAWREDGTGYTIDYGIQEVHGTKVGSDEGLDEALVRALHARREAVTQSPYTSEDGRIRPLDLTLVDSGYRDQAIYRFCREAGLGFRPAKGFGKTSGCAAPNFHGPVRSSPDKKVGDRWFLSRQPGRVWLVCTDADHWKAWEHDRWLTAPDRPGSLMLFGEPGQADRMSADQKWHFSYAKHLTNEVEVEEVIKGRLVRRWKNKSDTNHFFDASYLSDVAASMVGVRLVGQATPEPQQGSWYKQPKHPQKSAAPPPVAAEPTPSSPMRPGQLQADGWVSG